MKEYLNSVKVFEVDTDQDSITVSDQDHTELAAPIIDAYQLGNDPDFSFNLNSIELSFVKDDSSSSK